MRVISKGVHGTVGFARKSGFTGHHSNATAPEDREAVAAADNVSVQSRPQQGKPWKKHFNKNKKEKTRRLNCVLND